MGVYSVGELRNISKNGLLKMKGIHENDLKMYFSSEPYPTRERDIKETQENIKILGEVIQSRI